MLLQLQQNASASHDGADDWYDHRRYRLFGNLLLAEPELHLDGLALRRLKQLEPSLRQLESAATPSLQGRFDLDKAFRDFQELESTSWVYPRRKDELVAPSGSLEWPIAHHLHSPSFQTLSPHNGTTQDGTSACAWMVMAANFVTDQTLIFDHICRRESRSEGFVEYPESILDCHEAWLSTIRSRMAAKVEIIYGKKVQKRMAEIYHLEALQLWGAYKDLVVYLEWQECAGTADKRLIRLIVPAYHPQKFLTPGGSRCGVKQDLALLTAHTLAGLPYVGGFYTNFDKSQLNRKGSFRPNHYAKSREYANIATEELKKNSAVMVSSKFRRVARMRYHPGEQEIAQFKSTEVSQKYMMDSAKPPIVNVKCHKCGRGNKDYRPLWNIQNGKYIARRMICRDPNCSGKLAIPQESALSYIGYCGVKLPADTSRGKKHICSEPTQDLNVVEPPGISDHPVGLQGPFISATENASVPFGGTNVSAMAMKPATKGYNIREANQIAQRGDRGIHEFWHGREPEVSQMGRVRLRILRDAHKPYARKLNLDISTYGPFLAQPGPRILNFNDRGISLMSNNGKELWHRTLEVLAGRKGGNEILEQHRRELEFQKKR